MDSMMHAFADELIKTARLGALIKKHQGLLAAGAAGVGAVGLGALAVKAGVKAHHKGKIDRSRMEGYNNWAVYQNKHVDEINRDIEVKAKKTYGRGLADLNSQEWNENFDRTMAQPRWQGPRIEAYKKYLDLTSGST